MLKEYEKKVFVSKEGLCSNEIPSISVYGNNLAEAWETALLATYEYGCSMPTEYDQEIDPESRDATMMITVANPFAEPRIHKCLPCGYDDLEIYRQEVVNGVSDYKVGSGGWSYSYHDRMFGWPGIGSSTKLGDLIGKDIVFPNINQIEILINNLAKTPYSRRAEAITWFPFVDAQHHEPPCFQRLWCRIINAGHDKYMLEMNTHWRSRDALKAAFMNFYAFTDLQRVIADRISEVSGKVIGVGRYVDISDSYHIYGSYIRKGEMDKILSSIKNMPLSKRTVRSDHPAVLMEFERARKKLESD